MKSDVLEDWLKEVRGIERIYLPPYKINLWILPEANEANTRFEGDDNVEYDGNGLILCHVPDFVNLENL